MLEYLHLKNVGPAPEMEMELAPRLNLLTGDNGLGKSFLLDIAWWALTRRWPADVNPNLTSGRMARPAGRGKAMITFRVAPKREESVRHFDRKLQNWGSDAEPSGKRGLVLYAQSDGSFSVWDPARNYWLTPSVLDFHRPPAYVFSPQEVWDGLPLEPGPRLCNGLIHDWANWLRERGEALRQLAEVLRVLSPSADERLKPGELTRISLDDVRDIPTLRMPYGQDVPLLHASAGMRRVASLAYLLVWCWQEHLRASELLDQPPTRQAIFLIDEIESHLHPRWQRTIARALLAVVHELSADISVQIVTATHSPLVMASVEPWFDESRDAWFDLDLGASGNAVGSVRLEKRAWVRHGDAANWLISEAFDLGGAGSVEREQVLEKAAKALSDPRFGRVKAAALKSELQKVLPDTDDFWINWNFVGKAKGWLP